MKILLTGSSGFLGGHYAAYLRRLGHDLVLADRCIGVDLADQRVVSELPDVDIVIHFAAFNGTEKFYTQPYDVIRDNLLPTQYLLDRYSGRVDLFVHAGTCESYAGGLGLGLIDIPTREAVPLVVDDVTNPRWSYGGSKIANELQVFSAYHQYGQSFQILRFHNVYGPGQVRHFIPDFIGRLRDGDRRVYGANETRSFCYVTDAIAACYRLMSTKSAYNQIVNVGSGIESQIFEVAKIIAHQMGVREELIPIEGKRGSVARRCPDVSRLLSMIDWSAEVSMYDGIKLTLESMQ